MVRAALLAVALLLAPLAARAEVLPGPYTARVIRVIDGDTVEVQARIWLDQDIRVSVRLLGVDTPELKGKCKLEVDRAIAARLSVMSLLPDGSVVGLRDVQHDKFAGRVDARIELPGGRDLAAVLIERGLARAYSGGARAGWCA